MMPSNARNLRLIRESRCFVHVIQSMNEGCFLILLTEAQKRVGYRAPASNC